jgi:hypothetical protein
LDNGLYYVERALLEERHAFAERAAVSMDGFVTCILEKIRRSGEDHVWSPAQHAFQYFDSAYFTFELYRVCALLRGRGVSCDDPHTSIFLSHDEHIAESTEIDDEFNRVAILLKAEHFRRFCVGHRSSCPGGDRCKWVVTDGQHGTGPAICDNIHLHHLIVDGVNAIPCARSTHRTAAAAMASLRLFTILTVVCSAAPADGCRGKPGMRTNYCRQCVRLVAERTPHESEEPIYRDPGRADAAGAVVAEAFADVATTEQDAGLAGGEGAGVQDAFSQEDDRSEAGGSGESHSGVVGSRGQGRAGGRSRGAGALARVCRTLPREVPRSCPGARLRLLLERNEAGGARGAGRSSVSGSGGGRRKR